MVTKPLRSMTLVATPSAPTESSMSFPSFLKTIPTTNPVEPRITVPSIGSDLMPRSSAATQKHQLKVEGKRVLMLEILEITERVKLRLILVCEGNKKPSLIAKGNRAFAEEQARRTLST
jgi:hypothetical protein